VHKSGRRCRFGHLGLRPEKEEAGGSLHDHT
jgi:hypothetical protein